MMMLAFRAALTAQFASLILLPLGQSREALKEIERVGDGLRRGQTLSRSSKEFLTSCISGHYRHVAISVLITASHRHKFSQSELLALIDSASRGARGSEAVLFGQEYAACLSIPSAASQAAEAAFSKGKAELPVGNPLTAEVKSLISYLAHRPTLADRTLAGLLLLYHSPLRLQDASAAKGLMRTATKTRVLNELRFWNYVARHYN